ncbi:MAG: hypothetical protein CMG55_03445 [Candidatus Marinimicrobia bacterium]|nr:hypothetical protein [Candidatus Neomarinimicrobiota bacterium]
MPDAATHILIQIMFNKLIWIKKIAPYSLFGAIAPDFAKGLNRIISPDWDWVFYPMHSPFYMLFFFYAISMLFHKSERSSFILGSLLGMGIHLFLDILQTNISGSYYMPLFPFSFKTISLGLINTETSLFFLPLTILIVLLTYFLKEYIGKKI